MISNKLKQRMQSWEQSILDLEGTLSKLKTDAAELEQQVLVDLDAGNVAGVLATRKKQIPLTEEIAAYESTIQTLKASPAFTKELIESEYSKHIAGRNEIIEKVEAKVRKAYAMLRDASEEYLTAHQAASTDARVWEQLGADAGLVIHNLVGEPRPAWTASGIRRKLNINLANLNHLAE